MDIVNHKITNGDSVIVAEILVSEQDQDDRHVIVNGNDVYSLSTH